MSTARRRLLAFLRREHANEQGAARAYRGHARSVRDPEEARRIEAIEAEEWHHREILRARLEELGSAPAWFDPVLGLVGWVLGALCHVTGWLLPMLGAGWIERRNAQGYFQASLDAQEAGLPELARELVELGAVEVAHHAWFREQVGRHWLGRRLPLRELVAVPVSSRS
ncbi:MAG: ferritin-like domain-containing protein [Myxococcales bacterium]|nr:ferritin-like domain-containing protein [Myxococcales bacterium]